MPDNPTITNDYPPVVAVNQNVDVHGNLIKNITGVLVGFNGPNGLYHGEIISNGTTPTMWRVATNKYGVFRDSFYSILLPPANMT